MTVPERLPSGKHGLSREHVESSQRERVTLALLAVVAEKGYAATTIGDVVKRAGVSRRTFYEQFPSKEACFLTAFDEAVASVGAELAAALETIPHDDWRERITRSWQVFLAALAANPATTWSLYVESFSAGPAAIERTSTVNAGFAAIFRELHRRARKADPTIPSVPDQAFDLYIGGTAERIRHHLHTQQAGTLPELTDLFVDTMVILFGG